MLVTILKKRWRLRFVRISDDKHGDIDSPTTPNKEIRIQSNLDSRARLEALIHEMLHAADWSKDEEWVHYTAADIARELTKLGYRDGETNSSGLGTEARE